MRAVRLSLCVAVVALGCACSSESPTKPTTTQTFTPTTLPTLPADISEATRTMLNGLLGQISSSITTNQNAIPNNPHLYAQLTAKVAMLNTPSLGADIINGRRWVEGQSTSGRVTPVSVVFPMETMRGDAADALTTVAASLPVLESWFNEVFPTPFVRVWYGFVIGNSGGGGMINTEDRASYMGRLTPTMALYEGVLCHELSHSYMANEALNQFLEFYVYNRSRGASTDVNTWSYTRSWTPMAGSNTGSMALLDVYQLIGHDAMRDAYRVIRPLRPAYGSALTGAVIDAFLSAVPADLRDQVRAKLATIIA